MWLKILVGICMIISLIIMDVILIMGLLLS